MPKTGASGSRSKPGAQKRSVEPQAVGVVGGDTACIRAAIHHWTGRAPSSVLANEAKIVRLPDAGHRRDLVFLFEFAGHLEPWPGGPLIWMFPERGPSEPELSQMRLALTANKLAASALRVLLCLPADLNSAAACDDLDIISETLRWAINPDIEMDVEAVWLSGNHEKTLRVWLAALE